MICNLRYLILTERKTSKINGEREPDTSAGKQRPNHNYVIELEETLSTHVPGSDYRADTDTDYIKSTLTKLANRTSTDVMKNKKHKKHKKDEKHKKVKKHKKHTKQKKQKHHREKKKEKKNKPGKYDNKGKTDKKHKKHKREKKGKKDKTNQKDNKDKH